jgi:hypothetical protein
VVEILLPKVRDLDGVDHLRVETRRHLDTDTCRQQQKIQDPEVSLSIPRHCVLQHQARQDRIRCVGRDRSPTSWCHAGSGWLAGGIQGPSGRLWRARLLPPSGTSRNLKEWHRRSSSSERRTGKGELRAAVGIKDIIKFQEWCEAHMHPWLLVRVHLPNPCYGPGFDFAFVIHAGVIVAMLL